MTRKAVEALPRAVQDIDGAVDHYRADGGRALADRFVRHLEVAVRRIARHPAAGSMRYARALAGGTLRFVPVKQFPHLVFYIEHADRIDIVRVLHGHRDIPAGLRADESDST